MIYICMYNLREISLPIGLEKLSNASFRWLMPEWEYYQHWQRTTTVFDGLASGETYSAKIASSNFGQARNLLFSRACLLSVLPLRRLLLGIMVRLSILSQSIPFYLWLGDDLLDVGLQEGHYSIGTTKTGKGQTEEIGGLSLVCPRNRQSLSLVCPMTVLILSLPVFLGEVPEVRAAQGRSLLDVFTASAGSPVITNFLSGIMRYVLYRRVFHPK